MPINPAGLTTRQMLFCKEYLKDYNGTRSAIAAGYSANCASVTSYDNLRLPKISKYLDYCMKEAIEKAGVGLDWRLELAKKTAEASFSGRTNKDGVVDFQGVKSMLSEINKMAGDYAPVVSNMNVSTSNLEEAEKIADDAEKEINDIKTF